MDICLIRLYLMYDKIYENSEGESYVIKNIKEPSRSWSNKCLHVEQDTQVISDRHFAQSSLPISSRFRVL